MAKKGQKMPWKVRFEWDNGAKGVRAFTDEWTANHEAERIQRYGEMRDDASVTVEVFMVKAG